VWVVYPHTDKSNYDITDLKISFSPDPPEKGKNVTITASGTVSKLIIFD